MPSRLPDNGTDNGVYASTPHSQNRVTMPPDFVNETHDWAREERMKESIARLEHGISPKLRQVSGFRV